jgi:hypothetical protein
MDEAVRTSLMEVSLAINVCEMKLEHLSRSMVGRSYHEKEIAQELQQCRARIDWLVQPHPQTNAQVKEARSKDL